MRPWMNPEPRTHPPVLIVEDDADQCEMLSLILGRAGYDPLVASDGWKAWALLESGTLPRVILLDLALPGMSGWDFRAKQRREPRFAAIPIVAITGGHHSVGAVLAMGFDDYLTKPLTVEHLLA